MRIIDHKKVELTS